MTGRDTKPGWRRDDRLSSDRPPPVSATSTLDGSAAKPARLKREPSPPAALANRDARAELAAQRAEIVALRAALRAETRLREAAEARLARLIDEQCEPVGALAHQLAQPIAATLNYLNGCRRRLATALAAQPELAATLDTALLRASEQADQARRVVQHARTLIRRHTPGREHFDAGTLLRDTAALRADDCASAGIALTLDLPTGALPVAADPVGLQQVLLNLLGNAIDAVLAQPVSATGPAAARQIVLAALPVGDGRRLRIRVADSGPGIPPDALPRIFDSCYTTKRHGLGLGLAVCRTIVEAHGSHLVAERSTLGGASFHFELPLETCR